MIEQKQLNKNLHRIIIRPNPAMPWHQLKKIFYFFATFIFLIAIILTYINLYLAIPFYGIELFVLGYALYITALKSSYYEELIISDHEIVFSEVKRKKIKQKKFIREWTYFGYKKQTRTQPSELSIHDRGKKIILGQWVNEMDRKKLFHVLKSLQISVV